MYALNIGDDGRVLSATTASMAPSGAAFAYTLPDGNIYDYRYVAGEYIYDPLPKPEEVVMVTVTADELAVLEDKAAAYDLLTEGVTE